MLIASILGLAILIPLVWIPTSISQYRREFLSSRLGIIAIILIVLTLILGLILNLFSTLYLPCFLAFLALSIIDIKHHSVRIIDLVIATIVTLPLIDWATISMSLGLVLIIVLMLLAIKWGLKKIYSQDAFGGADIWIIALILLAFKGALAMVAIYTAIISSAISGLILILFFKRSRRSYLPFIPFLTLGVFLTLIQGPELLEIYFQWIYP
ncbi:MAG: hypothetical protein VW397_06860 [Candidatus Margulisiibacteriota bacterium]